MDQNRLFLAIVISIGILLGFEYLAPRHSVPQEAHSSVALQHTQSIADATAENVNATNAPRVTIDGPRVKGSLSLMGAKLDDLVLTDYRETVSPASNLVRMLERDGAPQSSYLQFGWIADNPNVVVPDGHSLWHADGAVLNPSAPLTLSWDNGEGIIFKIQLTLDQNFMFSVRQSVSNQSAQPVLLRPWARIRRGYTPPALGAYGGTQGLLGVFDNQLHELSYKDAKSAAEKNAGVAYQNGAAGSWAGVTDKYWLTAIIPQPLADETARFVKVPEASGDGWQVDYTANAGQMIAPGADASFATQAFVGAKEVKLLDQYEVNNHIAHFDKAVDFGRLYFISKPIFYALDWLYGKIGNFGLAIMAFTVAIKVLFFPLANRSYRSMNKMRMLAPKMQVIRERYKDDAAKMQSETMALYRDEKVNPASGCLPMLIQIPVFWALYSDLNTSIEMRHAPFFGWIHDLSAQDPTNLFNLFGLLPFDPTHYFAFAHLGAWPIMMGLTMYLQQRLNPQVPDPVQARMMQFMPLVFTFMMGRASAGLVIYWSWNNLLSLGQQWLIMRQTSMPASIQMKS